MSDTTALHGHAPVSTDFWQHDTARKSTGPYAGLAWLQVLLRCKWPILLITALATCLAAFYVSTVEPAYRSTQTLLLEPSPSNVIDIRDTAGRSPEDPGYVQTQIELLGSTDLARRVMDSLQLLEEPAFASEVAASAGIDARRLAQLAGEAGTDDAGQEAADLYAIALNVFLGSLEIEQVPTTRLVHISYTSTDRQLAARIANEIGQQYILDYLESHREQARQTSGQLGERLDELKSTFEASEQRLLEFRRRNELVNVAGNVGEVSEQDLLQAAEELTSTRLALSNANDLLTELQRMDDTSSPQELLPSLRTDSTIQQISNRISETEQELSRLANQYGPRNPRIVSLRSALTASRNDLDQAVRQAIEAQQNKVRLLERQAESLETRLNDGKQALQKIGTQRVQLEALEREVQTNRDLYYTFFSRLIENRSTRGLEAANATITESASAALNPVSPNSLLIIALTAIGSLALAALGAIIISAFDDSIRNPDDARQSLGLQLLGLIPVYRSRPRWYRRLLRLGPSAQQERTRRRFTEAFNSVRTQLQLGSSDRLPKTLLLTSAVPGEGKSMCSVCLAQSFAQMEKVLLIDADLRRPSLSRAMGCKDSTPGLTSLVGGHHSLEQCIRTDRASGFDLLSSGPLTRRPLELLGSRKFEDLLAQLVRRYDRVIIDCAPVEAFSDAALLSRQVDAVVFIAKSRDTSMRLIDSALEQLRAVQAPLAGLLLTQVESDQQASHQADYDYQEVQAGYGSLAADRPVPDLNADGIPHLPTPKRTVSNYPGRYQRDKAAALGRSRRSSAA